MRRQLRCFGADAAVTSVAYSPVAESELYAAAGEEIFCFDLRKLGGEKSLSAGGVRPQPLPHPP